MKYVLAIDQGTTSTRAILFDENGTPAASSQISIRQLYPENDYVEQDPEEYIKNVLVCLKEVQQIAEQKGIRKEDVVSVGITNQRETTILFDRMTGEPVYNAIVWSDTRTRDTVDQLRKRDGAERVPKICGLPLSTYFAGVKARWILDNIEKAKEVYERGDLAFATVDTWFLYRLTGGANNGGIHVTDTSNASRSMFMDLETLEYSKELIRFFDVEKLVLPEIRSSSEVYGHMKVPGISMFDGLPIAGDLGDQSAAIVGHLGFKPGTVKNTYGTGCFLLCNVGDKPVVSQNGLISTVAFHQKGHRPYYALEGSIAVAGGIIKWLKEEMNLLENPTQIGQMISYVPDNQNVYFVTAFSGLYAPYWNEDARGTLVGLTHSTGREVICRAAMESVCFQTRALVDAIEQDVGGSLSIGDIRVDGGMSSSNEIMQIQADVLGYRVVRPPMREPTALGAAIAAGIAVGLWGGSVDKAAEVLGSASGQMDVFEPKWSSRRRKVEYDQWNRAVDMARMWAPKESYEDDNEN